MTTERRYIAATILVLVVVIGLLFYAQIEEQYAIVIDIVLTLTGALSGIAASRY